MDFPPGCRVFTVLSRLARSVVRTLPSAQKALVARRKGGGWFAGNFLERKSRSWVFSSSEVFCGALKWGALGRRGRAGQRETSGQGEGSGKSSLCYASPSPAPSPHTDTRTLVVGLAAAFTAHLLGFNRSLQARDSVSKHAVRGLPLSHIIKPHLEMVWINDTYSDRQSR